MKTYAGKRFLAFVLASLAFTALAGCNTIDGAGKDIEKAGEEIQEEAEDAEE